MIFLACPSYGGLSVGTHKSALQCSSKNTVIHHMQDYSALCYNFNSMWCEMLNTRKQHGITHFCMLHSDIAVIQPRWLDLLMEEMGRSSADVLSVVVPLKDSKGLTSTAVFDQQKGIVEKRLTIREVEKLPQTFTMHDIRQAQLWDDEEQQCMLVVNTGLMLVQVGNMTEDGEYVAHDWCEKVCFRMEDSILKVTDTTKNTVTFMPRVITEDWLFSIDVQRKHGLSVMGTTVLKVEHMGRYGYPNYGSWGQLDKDDFS